MCSGAGMTSGRRRLNLGWFEHAAHSRRGRGHGRGSSSPSSSGRSGPLLRSTCREVVALTTPLLFGRDAVQGEGVDLHRVACRDSSVVVVLGLRLGLGVLGVLEVLAMLT